MNVIPDSRSSANEAADAALTPRYQLGFGNEFATEAMPGALPDGQNSPQKPPYGLYSELVSGTSFAAPRAYNRRSYLFRIRPSVCDGEFAQIDIPDFRTPPLDLPPYPGQLRYYPIEDDGQPRDFIDGILTLCANGTPKAQEGMAIHVYRANRSMENKAFSNADGEMLIIPQLGGLRIVSEYGIIDAAPGEFILIPKAIKFRVELADSFARGTVVENYGHPFILPELGLIGSNGLANAIDFEIPVAAFEDLDEPYEWVHKLGGHFWNMALDHSPFDVVAWRGSFAPCKYDMYKFVAMGTVTVDHPDPSIFCALTSPSNVVSGCNCDMMILPPRWLVAEHSFRPPGFHRNTVAEFGGVLHGRVETKAEESSAGMLNITNPWAPHGPDATTIERGTEEELSPTKIDDTLFYLFETRYPWDMTNASMEMKERKRDHTQGWADIKKRFPDG